MDYKKLVNHLGAIAGVSTVNGNPWDSIIHNDNFYKKLIAKGSLGLGEAYMDGWWDCEQLDEFFYRVIKFKVREKIKQDWTLLGKLLMAKLFNQNTLKKSKRVVDLHYNLDVDIFKAMLGESMSYTCAYWTDAETLDEAQYAKFELICKKLQLNEGDRVLDVGSGFGTLAKYMAEHYGCKVTGINISQSHHDYASGICGDNVRLCLCDYRSVSEYASPKDKFDKIVSVGMFEAVGTKNFKTFFRIMHRLLRDEGVFLLHTIGTQTGSRRGDPWIQKYIFPGGMIPTTDEITKASNGLFVLEDWHNFGYDYYKTLKKWFSNFHKYWVHDLKRDIKNPFYRMWKYYLYLCAGSFRARDNSLWQIVFSKGGFPHGYRPIR